MEFSIGEVVVEYLKSEGVRYAFGVIGSSELEIMDAIYRNSEIRFMQTQHEQASAFMADGYARISGKPGVCLVAVGPGSTNLMTGIAQAYIEASPVVVIAAEGSTKHFGKDVSAWHEVEQTGLFRHITKYSVRLERPERIAEVMQRAFREATTGRPGPTYVGIPRDMIHPGRYDGELSEPLRRLEIDTILLPEAYRPTARPRGDSRQIARAVDLILSAEHPVLLTGGGILAARATKEATELAEWLGLPVATPQTHKGLVPEDHPLALGSIGASGRASAIKAVSSCDVLLAVGSSFSELSTARFSNRIIPRNAKIIHVDIDPNQIGKSYPVSVAIVGDAKSVLCDILEELGRRGITRADVASLPCVKEIAKLKEEWEASIKSESTSDAIPMSRLRVLKEIRQAIDRNALVVVDPSQSARHFLAYTPIIQSGEYAALGCGIGLALGAKLAAPERQVVCVSGDGAFMMTIQELATMVSHDIRILVIVLNDSAYGSIKRTQGRVYQGRHIGVDLPIPNLADVAHLFGAFGERVTRPADLQPAIRRALDSGRPAVIEAMVAGYQ